MMKIDLKDIIKIQHLEMEIFEEEDNDYVDYRIVKNKERAIYRRLAKTSSSKEEQEKVRKCIYSGMWNQQDTTFKPICDEIRKLGYEVIS